MKKTRYQANRFLVALLLTLNPTAGIAQPALLQPRTGEILSGATLADRDVFFRGLTSFDHSFTLAEGLGPVINNASCSTCHFGPAPGGRGNSGSFGPVTHFGSVSSQGVFDPLIALGGSLLQERPAENLMHCAESIPPQANHQVRRFAIAAFGVGLIDAIPDSAILHHEQYPPSPRVSGRAHLSVPLEGPPNTRVGRFGWKAQIATLLSFSATAARDEMGITNRLLPTEAAPNGDPARLQQCDTVADPEDNPTPGVRSYIDQITDFQRLLSAPPQTPATGMLGETIFHQIGCADCHIPSFQTGNDPSLHPLVRGRVARAYSDFLLHDMGTAGDGIAQGSAARNEMRTAPLWGLQATGGANLWHDGTSSSLDAAILRHGSPGSEATFAATNYQSLSAADKQRLQRFLNSLGQREFDHSGDALINSNDWNAFRACYAQATQITRDDVCAISDIDSNGDVGAQDAATFAEAFEGPESYDCDCNGTNDLIDILNGAPTPQYNPTVLATCGWPRILTLNGWRVSPGQPMSLSIHAQQGDLLILVGGIDGRGRGGRALTSCFDIRNPVILGNTIAPYTGYNTISIPTPVTMPNVKIWVQLFIWRSGMLLKTAVTELDIR